MTTVIHGNYTTSMWNDTHDNWTTGLYNYVYNIYIPACTSLVFVIAAHNLNVTNKFTNKTVTALYYYCCYMMTIG
jgi:hypothetical protein